MTLKKASQIIELNIKEAGPTMPPDVLEALKLHSEGLKAIVAWRTDHNDDLLISLPEETHE